MKSHRPRWIVITWTAAVLPALLAVDTLLGLGYNTNTRAGITVTRSRSGTVRRAIVVFPGYIMPGDTLSRAFAPFVADDDALVVVSYAQRGVNPAQISAAVLRSLQTVKPRELLVYGASMGGMLSTFFLDRYRKAGAPYGKVTLVLDSAPATGADVKWPELVLATSCCYRGGPVSSVVLAIVNALTPKPPLGAGANPAIVRVARQEGAWAGMPAASSQACFVYRFYPPDRPELADVVDHVIYLRGDTPASDPVVRTTQAIAKWQRTFPGLRVVTVQGRNACWHLPLVEYPLATVRAMTSRGVTATPGAVQEPTLAVAPDSPMTP